jgi:putative membrane protein insertion efficiency factor
MGNSASNLLRKRRPIARLLHGFYKVTLSPFVGRFCRFQPTCSDYALEAVEVHGWLRGGGLAIKRILRCHPRHPGGCDPVPHCSRAQCG